MIIYLVGMCCVGKTTIGNLLANYINYQFYDLDREVEKYYNITIEQLQKECFSMNEFRKKASVVLDRIFNSSDNIVVAGTPSGLKYAYWNVYKKNKIEKNIISIHIYDSFQNVLDRLTFYDKDSNLINLTLNEDKKRRYLKVIKDDYNYFKQSYKRADIQLNIQNCQLSKISNEIIRKIESYNLKSKLHSN